MITTHLQNLMEIARLNRVQVHFLDASSFPDLDWDGLYVVDSQMGAGIAVRDDLSPEWRDWILAHELGHHFSNLNGMLFSPFRAHKVDKESRKRWGQWRKLDPDEEKANRWAVNALVEPGAWLSAENRYPCDLNKLLLELGLPLPAAIAWERQRRSSARTATEISVQLSPDEWKVLERSITGNGGHQAFFRRLHERRRGTSIVINFCDFSYARERVNRVSGGWLSRYQSLMRVIGPLIQEAGGVGKLFGLSDVEIDPLVEEN
ncbi:ImmA/IrrE family metallo-endopeptidase [Luteolibacter sp. Populi]|uniref:ImmA/IrrE family metallo-endopeptidase n=1 Tax=Luteolibacter sp. Populi TaxID=3230487 RepID=UPI003467D722